MTFPSKLESSVIKSYSGRSSSSSIKLVVMLDLMDGNVITPPLLAQSSGTHAVRDGEKVVHRATSNLGQAFRLLHCRS